MNTDGNTLIVNAHKEKSYKELCEKAINAGIGGAATIRISVSVYVTSVPHLFGDKIFIIVSGDFLEFHSSVIKPFIHCCSN